jgi:hypothetical protein
VAAEGLVSMKQRSGHFKKRHKEETIRRYILDPKGCGLIALPGRGPEAQVQLTAPASPAPPIRSDSG